MNNVPPVRFAMYARTSTEDQQSPQESLNWQRARATNLIGDQGEIVATFHDVGQSRSLPWLRRPQATALLDEAAIRAGRRFDAVVIAEPARAFYGGQFGLVYPVLTHHGVDLWVPEVGGRVDPGSEAHDMVMMLFGGMSKGERQRIKVRVKTAMTEQAKQGRWLGGRPPYGYRLVDDGPHPNPGKARDGKRLYRLEPDPITAEVVRRIFTRYIAGDGLRVITDALTADRIPSPSATDPDRNRHRLRSGGAWARSAVRAITLNPVYTGRQVWGRASWDESKLFDINNPALGQRRRQVWNDPADWITSTEVTHPAIITDDMFAAAARQREGGTRRATRARSNPTTRAYPLRGLVWCDSCSRRMEARHESGRSYYRCRLTGPDYARTPDLDLTHPKYANLSEKVLLATLDEWLGRVFDPDHLDDTVAALATAEETPARSARLEAAYGRLAACDGKLAKYRAALEAGADPALVAEWIKETQRDRTAAQAEVSGLQPAGASTEAEIRDLIVRLADVVARIRDASPEAKMGLYQALGVRIGYVPGSTTATVEVVPGGGVGGGT